MDTKKKKKISPYMVFSTIVIILLAIAFAFPLYWILTGSFKTQISINSTTPEWWPSEWVMTNYDKLFSRQKAPLPGLIPEDEPIVAEAQKMIEDAVAAL